MVAHCAIRTRDLGNTSQAFSLLLVLVRKIYLLGTVLMQLWGLAAFTTSAWSLLVWKQQVAGGDHAVLRCCCLFELCLILIEYWKRWKLRHSLPTFHPENISVGKGSLKNIVCIYIYIYIYIYGGTEVAQRLRCCVTNRKVAGSIPAGVIGIFHWHKIFPIELWLSSRLSL